MKLWMNMFQVALPVLVCAMTAGSGLAEMPKDVLAKLASDQFSVRQTAYTELQKWSKENIKTSPEILHKAWRSSKDPEVKTRCYTLMKEVAVQRKFGRGKGFVGVRMEEFVLPGKPGEKQQPGVRISLVLPKTPAEKAGIKVGDVVTGVDEVDFKNRPKIAQRQDPALRLGLRAVIMTDTVQAFSDYIQSKQPDDVITLHITRQGKPIDVKVSLMKRPASADVDAFGRSNETDTRRQADQFFQDWMKEMGD